MRHRFRQVNRSERSFIGRRAEAGWRRRLAQQARIEPAARIVILNEWFLTAALGGTWGRSLPLCGVPIPEHVPNRDRIMRKDTQQWQ